MLMYEASFEMSPTRGEFVSDLLTSLRVIAKTDRAELASFWAFEIRQTVSRYVCTGLSDNFSVAGKQYIAVATGLGGGVPMVAAPPSRNPG